MKTKITTISIFLLLYIFTSISPQKAAAQGASVSFQIFYDELSPYGSWINSPDYGYVWVPNVEPGFSPYETNGYWILTDDGWTWVSNYSWGWAPFHYGRWFHDATYGPMWVPDNEWGPGWVTWRRSEGYYGWAPIGPGISISIAYGNGYNLPGNQWRFVRDRDFGRRDINNYYVNTTNNITIINNSTVINNTRVDPGRHVTYNTGPGRTEVEKHAGRKFAPVAIKETSKPGEKLNQNQLQIYRPQVQKTVSNGTKPAPVKVESVQNLKPASQRTGETQPVNRQQAQPAKQQAPPTQQRNVQPANQQQAPPPQQQRNAQPAKQQQAPPPQQQRNAQPAKQQQTPPSQQHKSQPAKQQQTPPSQQHNAQPAKQQQAPPSQQHKSQPAKQQQTTPPQQQRNAQPVKQQQAPPPQQQHNAQPAKQQQSNPPKNNNEEKPFINRLFFEIKF